MERINIVFDMGLVGFEASVRVPFYETSYNIWYVQLKIIFVVSIYVYSKLVYLDVSLGPEGPMWFFILVIMIT